MFGRKRYIDDYDADEAENGIGGSFIPPAKLDWLDGLIAFVLAVGSAAFIWALSYKGLHPSAWSDCVVAAGLRPATTIMPGLWRYIAHGIYAAFGIGEGNLALNLLGKASVGMMVGLAYLLGRETLAILVRIHDKHSVWTHRIARWVAILTALMLLCAEPVWQLGQVFLPTTMLALEFLLTAFLLARFLGSGKVWPVYCAMFLVGVFGSETPLGLVMLAVFWLIFYLLLTKGSLFHVQLLDPLLQQTSKWLITFLWAMGLLAGIAVNVFAFISFDGLSATDMTLGGLPLAYAIEQWHIVTGAATVGGWIVGLGFTVLPFVLAVALLRRATDLEYFLNYHVGIVFFVVGCLAYSQLASLQPLWFWTWSRTVAVDSSLLLFVGMTMDVLAVLATLSVVCVDAFCRDHRRLAEQIDPDVQTGFRSRHAVLYRTLAFAFVWLLLLAGSVPGRHQPMTQRMLGIIDAYVAEILNEAGDARWLFTDGQFDCGIELESARRNGPGEGLVCLSLGPGPNGRAGYALQSHMEDDEDRLCAQRGGPCLLRTWLQRKIGSKSGDPTKVARIDRSALMLGIKIWKDREGLDYPPISGVLAKTVWPSREALEQGRKNGSELVARVLSVYAVGGLDEYAGELVRHLFLCVQWRLARLAELRSKQFDREGDVPRAKAELATSENLDDLNESRKRLLAVMMRVYENTKHEKTPREGLQDALHLANFYVARNFAKAILDTDPDDSDANFGMGMSYLIENQYARAEDYFKRALIRRPGQPTFWNNLAYIQYCLGHYDDALKNARKALELMPESAEIKDTLKTIEDAIAGKKPAPAAAQPAEAPAEGK